MDAMSKKEKLARGSAVIKVMRVNPRPGRYLKSYIDPRKIPKAPVKSNRTKGIISEMPHLDVKNATFEFQPKSAKISIDLGVQPSTSRYPCSISTEEDISRNTKLSDRDPLLKSFGYKDWVNTINSNQ